MVSVVTSAGRACAIAAEQWARSGSCTVAEQRQSHASGYLRDPAPTRSMEGVEMLNESPLLDSESSLPEVDAHPSGRAGWLETRPAARETAEAGGEPALERGHE